MASLVKRGKYYHGVISINGKQVWRSLRTGDREEAERRLAELEAKYSSSPTFVKGNITVKEFYALWMDRYVRINLKPTTESRYKFVFEAYILPILGSVRLCDLNIDHLHSLVVHLKSRGMKSGTLSTSFAVMGSMLSAAEDWGYIEYNMAKKVKLPSKGKPTLNVWTPEEAARFLNHTKDHPLYPMWVTAILTGMRRGELCGLRWRDVDFKRGVINVVWQVTVLAGSKTIEQPVKSKYSERSIAMGPQLSDFLLRHKETVESLKKAYWHVWNHDKDYVFPHVNHRTLERTGSFWHPDLVLYHFKRQCKLAGVPRIRFHDLRHTHFTHLSEAGVSLSVIRDRAGHSSVSVTGDLYTHPTSRAHVAAASVGESVLFANTDVSNPLATSSKEAVERTDVPST